MKTNLNLKTATWIFLCAFMCTSVSAQMSLTPEPIGTQTAPPSGSAIRKAMAENKFYVKVYGFYGLLSPGGFSGQGVDPSTTYSYSSAGDNTVYTTKGSDYKVEKSFGSGLRIGAGVGVVINDFINLGVDGEYVLGSTVTESYTTTSQYKTNSNPPVTNYQAKITRDYTYRIVNIIPNVTFKAVSKPEYYIYNRLGVIVGIPTQLDYVKIQRYTFPDNPSARYEIVETNDLDKGIGLGYQAALGIQFRIGDNLRGFAEIVLSSVQLKANGSTLTEAQYTYVDDTPTNQTEPIEITDENRRTENLNLKIPVASIGVGVGLVFRF